MSIMDRIARLTGQLSLVVLAGLIVATFLLAAYDDYNIGRNFLAAWDVFLAVCAAGGLSRLYREEFH